MVGIAFLWFSVLPYPKFLVWDTSSGILGTCRGLRYKEGTRKKGTGVGSKIQFSSTSFWANTAGCKVLSCELSQSLRKCKYTVPPGKECSLMGEKTYAQTFSFLNSSGKTQQPLQLLAAAPALFSPSQPHFSNETSTFVASQSFPKRVWQGGGARWIFIDWMNGQTRIQNAVGLRGRKAHGCYQTGIRLTNWCFLTLIKWGCWVLGQFILKFSFFFFLECLNAEKCRWLMIGTTKLVQSSKGTDITGLAVFS